MTCELAFHLESDLITTWNTSHAAQKIASH